MLAADTFFMKYQKMSCSDLVPWLLDTATLQEAHPFHRVNWPDWVPGAVQFRQHAEALAVAVKAAENKDREKTRERDQLHADILESVTINANYIVMRARHEKDEGLLHNVGYVLKEKTRKNSGQPSISTTPLDLKVKNGGDAGSVALRFSKDPAAGSYQLQICKGDPAGEASWADQGIYKNCMVTVKNLERASWYYFRVRSHGNNQASPWSSAVGIIVV
jgi:hypothetical protein